MNKRIIAIAAACAFLIALGFTALLPMQVFACPHGAIYALLDPSASPDPAVSPGAGGEATEEPIETATPTPTTPVISTPVPEATPVPVQDPASKRPLMITLLSVALGLTLLLLIRIITIPTVRRRTREKTTRIYNSGSAPRPRSKERDDYDLYDYTAPVKSPLDNRQRPIKSQSSQGPSPKTGKKNAGRPTPPQSKKPVQKNRGKVYDQYSFDNSAVKTPSKGGTAASYRQKETAARKAGSYKKEERSSERKKDSLWWDL